MRTVHVALGNRSYEIKIGSGLLKHLGKDCARLGLGTRCAIISDRNVAPNYAGLVLESLVSAGFDPLLITVPAGEKAKCLATVHRCFDQLARRRLERKSFIVALGGGVVGDLAGFVAATYLRGIAFVQVPTTLLAQVDSSVGGKVGVNLRAGKNLVGAFHQPRMVWCDLDTLKTIPLREYRSGLAEVIKYGIIRDASLFNRLERDLPRLLKRETKALAPIIARCCEIKAGVVGVDETEGGLRGILNFGHSIGHALEAISHYGQYLHGEAISLGQIAAAEISAAVTGLSRVEVERIRTLFQRAGLPIVTSLSAAQRAKILSAMRLDKKVSGGEIKFVLARSIGAVEWGQAVPAALIQSALGKIAEDKSKDNHAMAAVSETIVREYFELHEFLVRQHRKYIAQIRRDEDDIDFFVLNPKTRKREVETPFVLSSTDLEFIERAIVVVKGWHTETFSPAVLAHSPEIFRFVEPKVFQQAARSFGNDGKPIKILVVPALPQAAQARADSIALLRSKGVDAVIPFRTMLADLVESIEVNRNYQKSDLLQMIRILKNYEFLKEPQMELFKTKRKRAN